MSRKSIEEKRKQAHYICTELREPLAELILKIKGHMLKGKYKHSSDYARKGKNDEN